LVCQPMGVLYQRLELLAQLSRSSLSNLLRLTLFSAMGIPH